MNVNHHHMNHFRGILQLHIKSYSGWIRSVKTLNPTP